MQEKLLPLPPPLELVETIAILRKANEAATSLAELKGFARTIPNQKILVNAIIIQEAKSSSEVENLITTQDEIYMAITANRSNANSTTREVVNYRACILRGHELIQSQKFLRINDIVELQAILLQNNAGIRTNPGTVLKNEQTGEVVYTPPQDHQEIQDLLSNFIEHFNADDSPLSPLINMAILHAQFESIHPFYDGNGRTGRILNVIYLTLNNLIDLPILFLSSYIIKNKSEYYQLLNKVNSENKWEEWIIYVLEGIHQTAKATIHKIEEIHDLLATTIESAKIKTPKIYRKELIELLFEFPYCKIEYVQNKVGVKRLAASRYLQKLEKEGFLRSQKVGREKIYINQTLLNCLGD